LVGTSDADVALHAVIDAILGATALGDIGELFPSTDPAWQGADSGKLLADANSRVQAAGFRVTSLDLTIIAESVRIAPHRDAMRRVLSAALGLEISGVSVKATSTDGMGAQGRGEGIAATAVATVVQA
jgi:2-C-methyl-D-erythritol 4-phosphate cytidylyltransferase/2-C-methyl-D-erythritol 2,4-cyclodiphosphate synthase